MLKVKRIYDLPASSDGFRVLVDRLWPRGVSKQRAHLDPMDERDRSFGRAAQMVRT